MPVITCIISLISIFTYTCVPADLIDLAYLLAAGNSALYTNMLPSAPPVTKYLLSCDRHIVLTCP